MRKCSAARHHCSKGGRRDLGTGVMYKECAHKPDAHSLAHFVVTKPGMCIMPVAMGTTTSLKIYS